jgi:DNA polymerase-3 subunit chi
VTEVLFYHLESQPLEKVMPVLLEKTLERGWRAVVEIGNPERVDLLDQVLWTYRDDSFLPHGRDGQGALDALHPILLTSGSGNANNANVRFFVDRAVPQEIGGYDRVVYLFSGHDPDAVTEARGAWRALSAGNSLTYWQQDNSGRWVKKA